MPEKPPGKGKRTMAVPNGWTRFKLFLAEEGTCAPLCENGVIEREQSPAAGD